MAPPFGRSSCDGRAGAVRAARARASARRDHRAVPQLRRRGDRRRGRGSARWRCSRSTRRSSITPDRRRRLLDRALLVEPMRRWRERLCANADLIVTPSAAILPPAMPPEQIVELEWGADTDRFHPGAEGEPRSCAPPSTVAVFAGAFRSWHGAVHLVAAIESCAARGRTDVGAVFVGDGPELPRVREAAARARQAWSSPARCRTRRCPRVSRRATSASRRSTSARTRRCRSGFYWSPLKIFEYMAAGLPVVAPAVDRIPVAGRRTDARDCLYRAGRSRGAGIRAGAAERRRACAPTARSRGSRARRARLQLGGALPRARMRRSVECAVRRSSARTELDE